MALMKQKKCKSEKNHLALYIYKHVLHLQTEKIIFVAFRKEKLLFFFLVRILGKAKNLLKHLILFCVTHGFLFAPDNISIFVSVHQPA